MTLLEKFKKDNPTAPLNYSDGTPDVCPSHMGYLKDEHCIRDACGQCDCGKCWGQKYEDAKKILPSLKDSLVKAGEAAEKCDKQDSEIIDTFKKGIESGDIKPHILDSGDRTEFETGAVRDMREGKGRCDLLPLDVVSDFTNNHVLGHIYEFQYHNDTLRLEMALNDFVELYTDWCGDDSFAKVGMSTMLLEVAKHFEEGAKKYGDNNWQKGIPVRCYIDSAVRHYLKYLRGDKDEPHDRAFCWNILCAIWTCKHKPELNDYAKEEEKNENS